QDASVRRGPAGVNGRGLIRLRPRPADPVESIRIPSDGVGQPEWNRLTEAVARRVKRGDCRARDGVAPEPLQEEGTLTEGVGRLWHVYLAVSDVPTGVNDDLFARQRV